MRTLTLTRSASITLDGSGNGTAQIGPAVPGEVWHPVAVNISSSGNAPTTVATCFIYAGGAVSQGAFIDSTYNVLGAASGVIEGKVVYPGQYIFAVFSACNVGATATLAVNGTRTVP